MNTKLIATMAAVLTLGLANLAQAANLEAKIPFDFKIGERVLPAGHYEILPGGAPGLLLVRLTDWRVTTFILTTRVERGSRQLAGMLQFNRFGNSYYLSRIWAPGSESGSELQKSKRQIELSRTTSRIEVASVPLSESVGH